MPRGKKRSVPAEPESKEELLRRVLGDAHGAYKAPLPKSDTGMLDLSWLRIERKPDGTVIVSLRGGN